ncbi:hypothetical protein [Streptomyces sp. NPDC001851]|uniref:hypothetical protein n=1 Tax=Streptomyces sp. NPDC001851 TaxID=3154529 RepID=UPI003318A2F3
MPTAVRRLDDAALMEGDVGGCGRAVAGWFCAPCVKDWWLVRTACDGALPSAPVRHLAAGGGHFTKADTTAPPGPGDYGCGPHFEGRGDATPVVRTTACTGRDDQDGEFLFLFP